MLGPEDKRKQLIQQQSITPEEWHSNSFVIKYVPTVQNTHGFYMWHEVSSTTYAHQ